MENQENKTIFVQAFLKRFKVILSLGFIACILAGIITYFIKGDIRFSLFLGAVACLIPLIFYIYYIRLASKSIDYIYSEITNSENILTDMPTLTPFEAPAILGKALKSKDIRIKKLTNILVVACAFFVILFYLLPKIITNYEVMINTEVFGCIAVLIGVVLFAIFYKRS